MNEEIFVSNPFQQPPIVELWGGWIAHVYCEGARWHVLSWSNMGVRCSEPRCIKNKPSAPLLHPQIKPKKLNGYSTTLHPDLAICTTSAGCGL